MDEVDHQRSGEDLGHHSDKVRIKSRMMKSGNLRFMKGEVKSISARGEF